MEYIFSLFPTIHIILRGIIKNNWVYLRIMSKLFWSVPNWSINYEFVSAMYIHAWALLAASWGAEADLNNENNSKNWDNANT